MRTIFDHLRLHAACSPTKPAIMLADRFVTYEMIASGIGSVQAAIATLSLDRERPVGVAVDLPTRHLIVVLALWKSGYSVCAVRPEQIALAARYGVAALLTDRTLPATPGVRAHVVDEKWFQSAVAGTAFDQPFPPERIARILFTSGSTGEPKAIGWSMRTLHRRIDEMFYAGIGAAPRFLTGLGLAGAGLTSVLRVLWSGNTACFAPPSDVLRVISSMAVTEVRAATSQITGMLRDAEEFGHSLHIPLMSPTGAQNTPDLVDSIRRVFGAAVLDSYTSTESGHVGLASDRVLNLRRQRGNCFVPVGEVEIVDENGGPAPRGREGRIRSRTDSMGWTFTGNLDGAAADRGDGWFYPGDLGRIDEDGLLIVTGRADEVINVGGVKFNPEMLESVLLRHPLVTDAAVVRMRNTRGGDDVCAALVAKENVELPALNEWLSRQLVGELASARIDRALRVASVPKTGSGKISREGVRKLLVEVA